MKKRIAKRRANAQLQPLLDEAHRNRPAILKQKQLVKSDLEDYIYLVEFDPMIFLDELWVDGQTLRFLNSLRTNILVSSVKFD